jgi:multicomponent Na+:H+ antiporter subunit E
VVGTVRTLRTTLVLLLFWLVVVPTEGWFDLVVGALAAWLVARWALWLFWPQRPTVVQLHPLRIPGFVLGLLWRIVVAALVVLRIVLSPRLPIEPLLVRQSVLFGSEAARIAYAHTISITPGTLTIDLDGDHFIVHALDPSMAREVRDGSLSRSIAALFGEGGEVRRHD